MHSDVLRQRQLMYLKIFSLTVSPCGNYLAASTNAGTVLVFKLNKTDDSDTQVQQCEIPVLAKRAYSLASTPHHLLCGDSRGVIRAWKWENLTTKVPFLEPAFSISLTDFVRHPGIPNDINSLTVVANESSQQHLYVGCGDGVVYCFDLSCGKLARRFDGHKDFIHQVIYNNKRSQLFSCSEDGHIKIWDIRSCQQAANIIPSSRKNAANVNGDWVGCIAVDTSGDFLAFGGGVQGGIYNIPMAAYATVLEPANFQAQATQFIGDKLVFGGQSSSLYVYSVDGKLENQIPLPALAGVFSITPCISNTIIAAAGIGSKIELVRNFAYRSSSITVSL